MSDGLGSVSYLYDQLSHMTSESRSFTGVGIYSLSYAYNIAGELTSITDPFGSQVGYNRNSTGKLTGVTGSGFGSGSTYASNFQYLASGRLKGMTYGDNRTLSMNFNSRLQVSHYEVSGVVSLDYQYQKDGRLKFADDLIDSRFDRAYAYDNVGRIASALSGAEARGEPVTNNRPYNQSFTYDVWDNLTARASKHWSKTITTFLGTHVDNRLSLWGYDADGRVTGSSTVSSTFDAAGQLVRAVGPSRRNNPALILVQDFDGDGWRVKQTQNTQPLTFCARLYFPAQWFLSFTARRAKPILRRNRKVMSTRMGRSWQSRILHSTWPSTNTMSRATRNKGLLTRIPTLPTYGQEHSLIL
jgi:YD repeat-containing protein